MPKRQTNTINQKYLKIIQTWLTTQNYINLLWTDFQQRHDQISAAAMEEEYFTSNYFDQVKERVSLTLKVLHKKLESLELPAVPLNELTQDSRRESSSMENKTIVNVVTNPQLITHKSNLTGPSIIDETISYRT